jgi:dUTP pyrophosphatase
MKKSIPLRILVEDEELIPHYGSELAAGADLKSASKETIVIEPGAHALVSTGIRMEIPEGYEVQIRPRSGLAYKHQITVLNTPGTIDADYRGEVGVLLMNHGKEPFSVTYGMRIAQMVLAPVVQADFQVETALTQTGRGEGGFGHTGTH